LLIHRLLSSVVRSIPGFQPDLNVLKFDPGSRQEQVQSVLSRKFGRLAIIREAELLIAP
jgi:hypothetical protein